MGLNCLVEHKVLIYNCASCSKRKKEKKERTKKKKSHRNEKCDKCPQRFWQESQMPQPKEGLLCEGGPSRSGRRPGESPHRRAPALRRGVGVAHAQGLNSDRKTAG